MDYGLSTIKDANGSTIASINRAGEVTGHAGSRCGILDGFTFESLREAAAYLLIVDKAFVTDK